MEKAADPDPSETVRHPTVAPTGGVPLSEERLRLLAPQWEAMHRTLRRMDAVELGETEPATLFVWVPDRP